MLALQYVTERWCSLFMMVHSLWLEGGAHFLWWVTVCDWKEVLTLMMVHSMWLEGSAHFLWWFTVCDWKEVLTFYDGFQGVSFIITLKLFSLGADQLWHQTNRFYIAGWLIWKSHPDIPEPDSGRIQIERASPFQNVSWYMLAKTLTRRTMTHLQKVNVKWDGI